MEGDRREWREHCILVRDVVGDSFDEAISHRDDFRVGTVGNNAVARSEVGPRRGRDDSPHIAIAHRNGLGEFAPNRLHRREETFGADFLPHLADPLGLLASLLQPTRAAELHQHALRTEGHQRVRGLNQGTPRQRARRGHVR